MPTALQGFRENNRERRGVGPPCQHSRAFSASGKGLKRWPLILSPTLRRREAPSRRMAAGSVSLVAVLRDARKSALLRTRLIEASIWLEPWKRSTKNNKQWIVS